MQAQQTIIRQALYVMFKQKKLVSTQYWQQFSSVLLSQLKMLGFKPRIRKRVDAYF